MQVDYVAVAIAGGVLDDYWVTPVLQVSLGSTCCIDDCHRIDCHRHSVSRVMRGRLSGL